MTNAQREQLFNLLKQASELQAAITKLGTEMMDSDENDKPLGHINEAYLEMYKVTAALRKATK